VERDAGLDAGSSGEHDGGAALVAAAAARLREAVGSVIVGKPEATTLLLVALLCEGHVLVEDVPGVGKTMLAKALARSLDLTFQRIQFTPDLLPSDVTGLSYFNQQSQRFEFRAGPIFANVVLADEINRATPRTQSALLEAMEERQVTIDGETRALPRPFIVLATQNPVELEGTFPLPEAQLDRFLLRLSMGYPDREEERQVARRFYDRNPLETLTPVLTAAEVTALAQRCRQVHVSAAVEQYLVDVVRATRSQKDVALGASPRATLALFRASQALAAVHGREYVTPDDVKALAAPLLGHRLVPGSASSGLGLGAGTAQLGATAVAEVLQRVAVPVEGGDAAAGETPSSGNGLTTATPPHLPVPATVRSLR
jgi:MoxR-like ATPase